MLDEATAFADPENEAALIKALAAAMRGRTVIMVAHRLNGDSGRCDIAVFRRTAQEMGNHTQLLAQGGLYQRLWQHYQQAQHWVPGGTQEEVVENEETIILRITAGASSGASLSQRWQSGGMLRRSMLALLLAAFMQGIAFACLYPIIDALLRGDAPQP